MDHTPIAQLSPELAAIESKHFRATVTLIWPYSSSARQLALLLAEPDVRLRRKNGQVRARFSSASAKAIATTGIGIGDEVVLSLRGAQFVTEGAISTPGRSIDWELAYAQTVVIRIFRNGEETANVELIDAPPTPTPASPLHRQSGGASSPALQYSSPAFLKRARLSDGPFFEAPYDPLADETGEGHNKKRRRKSYRDWKAWTYSARTPSPEKEDVTMDDELEWLQDSPSRAAQPPQTPTSPSRSGKISVADVPERTQNNERTDAETSAERDTLLSEAEYAFGGDTEVDTEVNTEEEYPAQGEAEADHTSTTEDSTDEVQHTEREASGMDAAAASEAKEENEPSGDQAEVAEPHQTTKSLSITVADEQATKTATPSPLFDAPRIAMPPPSLSALHNDLQSTASVALLTPIGKEPGSPTLRPLDSASLPVPSPFPVERDNNATSYFDHLVTSEQTVEKEEQSDDEQNPPSEASYIGETSFFSSIGSSKASGFHPNHESAFTPVRFTFGIDGAGTSRTMELSSPPPEIQPDGEREKSLDLSASTTVANTSFAMSDAVATSVPQNAEAIETGNEQAKETATSDAHVNREESQHPDVAMLSPKEEIGSNVGKTDNMTVEHMAQTDADEKPENTAAVNSASHSESSQNVEEPEEKRQPSPDIQSSSVEEQYSQAVSQDKDHHQHQSSSMDLDSHSEFANSDFATEPPSAVEALDEQEVTHTPSQEPDLGENVQMEQPFSVDYSYEASLEATDDYLQDAFPMDHLSQEFQYGHYAQSEQDSAVKESMEDDFHSQLHQTSTQVVSETPNMSASELPKTAAEQVHDVDEMQTADATSTVPANNTRSKAKAQTPTISDEVLTSIRTTRSTRSRGSVSSIARSVISPPRTRARSAKSPSQGVTQTSPSSVRIQSEFLSPEKSFPAVASAVRESPRKSLQRSLHQEFAAVRSQAEEHDLSLTKLEPPEGQVVSEDKRSTNVFVKDWEEGSKTPEHSGSPAPPLEELAGTTKAEFSSPVKPDAPGKEEKMDIQPSPGAGLTPKTRSRAKAERKKPTAKTVIETQGSQFASAESNSPSRRLRSKGPVEPATPSSRILRRTKRNVYSPSTSQESEIDADRRPEENPLPGEGEDEAESQGEDEGSPQALETHPERAPHAQTVLQNQRPMTPDATQKTSTKSQPSSVAARTRPNLLLTPRSTQITSAGPHSTQTDVDMDATAVSPSGKKTPNKTTPRRSRTATDAASTSLSPTLIEEPSSKNDPDKPQEPSIGLSTPLAYYTPLKDLLFFLNRSSQFHSSANPDILALVTSATTPSEKAKKGPKHWNTTLHITDASSWPATTTVQCFRPYREALPEATVGDVVLLRAFAVKSLNRSPSLVSADESAWCVWRWGKPVWGAKKGAFAELMAREEVKGPEVERGEGEWREVERLRSWFVGKVKQELQEKEESQVKTRSREKAKGAAGASVDA